MSDNFVVDNKRDLSIDIERCICMICIILAHVNPPSILHTIRSFDVVGLVMISAMCMRPYTSVNQYAKAMLKRIHRLVVPTYIFIVCVLFSVYMLCRLLDIPYIYDKLNIISAFCLVDGIGYVWIIRILLINAFLSPILFKLASLKPIYVYLISILLLIISKVLYMQFPYNGTLDDFIFRYIYLYTIGYFIIALYALVIKHKDLRNIKIHIIFSLIILLIYKLLCRYLYGDSMLLLEKHPPMLDWIIYGICITDIIIVLSNYALSYVQRVETISRAVTWFSKNSFQIYFIHAWIIILANLYTNVEGSPFEIVWWMRFLIVFTLSILIKITYDKVFSLIRK